MPTERPLEDRLTERCSPGSSRRPRKAGTAIGLKLVGSAGIWMLVCLCGQSIVAQDQPAKPHPALEDAPQLTTTSREILGDPINVALIATEEELHWAMQTAHWMPADPITLKSALRITVATVAHRPYADAPISHLFLWGRVQDLAFEQPIGGSPKQRHHVRFWRSQRVDENGRPLWLGAATFDRSVGISHTTGGITHHIAPDYRRRTRQDH